MNAAQGDGAGVIKLAVLAVGGQGGGVLANWIVDLVEGQGWYAQLTSVPGVAQRTGATIYYVEMAPDTGRRPVFALIPAPGDVDIVLAAELMEAGRAIQRGLVTEDRTVLVASTHRLFAVSEKTAPGDGIHDAAGVIGACEAASQRFIRTDMDRIAVEQGSVISASLFGGLCAAGVLPFPREAFEATIRGGGRGVEASLAAFGACIEVLEHPDLEPRSPSPPTASGLEARPTGPSEQVARFEQLERGGEIFSPTVRPIVLAGLRKTADYQDLDYAAEYLARVEEFRAMDESHDGEGRSWRLCSEAARHIANAMTYDDVIRVADLKTRATRTQRVRRDAGANQDQVLAVTEFFHPRLEEVLATLPPRISRIIEASPVWSELVGGLFGGPRRLRSDRPLGFSLLYALAGLRRFRRKLRRHQEEMAHMEGWLETARDAVHEDYDLAVELLRTRKLIKGYSDTHQRGTSKFDRVMRGAQRVRGQPDAARQVNRLIAAAREDEHGAALDRLLGELSQDAAQ